MNNYFVIVYLCMLFLHIVDDFYLQGILAQLKQKKWWKENYPDDLYESDYAIALIIHGFSWSFMIHLPILVYSIITHSILSCDIYFWSIVINCIFHAIIDNLKANANHYKISLTTDQYLHLIQISIVCVFFLCRYFVTK